MAMKKKFLGLAMAAMVAMPATGVYAASSTTTNTGNTIRVEKDEHEVFTQDVTVSGEIKRGDGSAAAGKITVELPTTMAFTVDQNSKFTGATYTVDNKSGCGIDVSVAQFTTKKSGITLKTKTEMEATGVDNLNRSNVSMSLTGKVDGKQKVVDLGEVANLTKTNEKILDVDASSQETIALEGIAGKQADAAGVDKDGATGEFTLVFQIQKDKQQTP